MKYNLDLQPSTTALQKLNKRVGSLLS